MRTRTILLVDDEENILQSLSRALKLEGFNVIIAHDGVTALDSLNDKSCDLMMLDVKMPRMDGCTAIRRLREQASESESGSGWHRCWWREVGI